MGYGAIVLTTAADPIRGLFCVCIWKIGDDRNYQNVIGLRVCFLGVFMVLSGCIYIFFLFLTTFTILSSFNKKGKSHRLF